MLENSDRIEFTTTHNRNGRLETNTYTYDRKQSEQQQKQQKLKSGSTNKKATSKGGKEEL
jgi:hypothetical protein